MFRNNSILHIAGWLFLVLIYSHVSYSQNTQGIISYKNGLKIEFADSSKNIKSELTTGGRIHYDISFINQSNGINNVVGQSHNGQQFRRIFLYHSGKLFYNALHYKIQFDFSGGQIGFRDVYIEPRIFQKNSIEGYLRIGQFKDPFRFENMLSSNNLSLIERSYIQNFAPLRNSGIMFHVLSPNQRFTYQFAYLENSTDAGVDISPEDGYNITNRLTFLPIHTTDFTIHTGIGFSWRDRGNEKKVSVKAKPPIQILPSYISYTLNEIPDTKLLNLETALLKRQLMIIAEYIYGNNDAIDEHRSNAYYLQVSYLLDHKSYHQYNTSLLGINDKISKQGVFELVVRYSNASFEEDAPLLTNIWDLTAGINYYFNSNFRIMADFSSIHLKSVGNTQGLNVRFQTIL